MFNNIQTMFLRAQLSKTEIQTLWGMIKTLRNSSKNKDIKIDMNFYMSINHSNIFI